jgi:hypothetical protein
VVQTAAKLVLEAICFEDNAYGFPVRGAVDAVREAHRLICRGYTDVVVGPAHAPADQAVAESADRGTG